VVARTIAQLDRFLENVPDVRFQTAYVGGGTPSVLPPRLLEALLTRISRLCPVEWTVEANPESLDGDFLAACRSAGVTRLSMGLQSMDDRLLAVLGRPGTTADNLRALESIGERWHGETSLDLIAGVPGQSPSSLLADVATVVDAGVAHASLYSLTIEPDTPLAGLVASGGVALNRPDHDDDLWLAGRAALETAGLRQYEVSNFARSGKECRHNLRYWHLEPYLGIGPGAVSTLPRDLAAALVGERGDAAVVRLSNPRDIDSFLGGRGIEVETVGSREFVLETLMMGLRRVDGIGRASFKHRFGCSLDDLAPGLWRRWEAGGLALADPSRLRLSDRGFLLLDALLRELAVELADAAPRPIDVRWPSDY
jgi:oxygen-independent coproporphyrinogen-3 oxidase